MKNLSQKEILNRISYFRTKKNMSAYRLGMELGHSKTYFYRVESGEIQLTLDTFLEILDILQVSLEEFFCQDLTETDLQIAKSIKALSKENKQIILDLIKKLS